MCASRWFTPAKGASRTAAMALASATPTSSEPMSPGPSVHATASMSQKVTSARSRASRTTGVRASTWARAAISGTIPPYSPWSSSCEAITLERISRSPRSTAADVSSHEVSMPRMIELSSQSSPGRSRTAGSGAAHMTSLTSALVPKRAIDLLADPLEQQAVAGRVPLSHDHHERVLVGLDVVALAHTGDREAELLVHGLRHLIGDAHLERDGIGALGDGLRAQGQEQPGPDLEPVVLGVHGDVGDVGLPPHEHHAGIPHDLPHAPGDQVGPRGALRQLGQKEAGAPRSRVDARLDRQDLAQVPPAHPGELDLGYRPALGPPRQRAQADFLSTRSHRIRSAERR